jgi:hypothetical protein
MSHQPPVELALGAPLQIRERADETVVGIRTASGWQELKRIEDPESDSS